MRILVVEDDRRLAELLRRGLGAEGFVVELAHDGRGGLHLAVEGAYDVIVLDVMLPGLNGYRVCARLREAGVWTPVLMLTAKDGEYDEAEGLDTGADDYVTKPFSYVALVARLRALVRRGSTELPLTAREFAVLEYLARRGGEVVTKREVLENVWDEAFEGDVNIVEVYVSALRRKIDAPFGRHTIHTVRGAGYRLAAEDPRP